MPRLVSICLVAVWCNIACANDAPEDTSRGDGMLEVYFGHQVQRIADAALADVKDRARWEKKRPELRRQFLDMMGLWPLPPRTDLKPVITGKLDAPRFTVEKLHFQSVPGLYVTANLYVPKQAKFPAPAVLYVCGHGPSIVDGVSYGNKVTYQHHPAWFAENGYVCLIIDSLQLGEIQGLHHGTSQFGMWWWQSLGYTPAGVECWNALRALDYLETRKEADPRRLGISGRSGGGAYSWWVAAADDRVQCIVPVAGIADLQAHLVEGAVPRYRHGVISGHCDCMYFVNTYRWDFTQVAALCAPRPLLLGNSDADAIFPVAGYRRMAEKVRRVYDLYGAGAKFALLETTGSHKDTPELRLGAYRWMNRWLKGDTGEATEKEAARFTPQQLKVLDRVPDDAANATIHESFLRPATVELPRVPEVTRQWWAAQSQEWLQALRERVFHGWPQDPPPLQPCAAADIKHDGVRLRAFDFTSEEDVELRLWLLTAEKVDKPSLVILSALDEPGWQEWTRDLGPAFQQSLLETRVLKLDEAKFDQNRRALAFYKWAFAAIAPRGVGPTRWAESDMIDGQAVPKQVRRRFALIGQTLDGQRVWDVRRALAVLRDLPDVKGVRLWLQGRGEMSGVALYAALFEPDVERLDLWDLPASHRQGPTFLNVRRILDVPQAVALAFPKEVRLHVKDAEQAKLWEWPRQLQKALGQEYLRMQMTGE
jgi:cephalosporin-C deacetylase-like acetyl esterase